MATRKTVRVLPAGVNVPSVRKVNILDSVVDDRPVWLQTEVDSRTFETVQDTGGGFPGIKTVCIDGYTPSLSDGALGEFDLTYGGEGLTFGGEQLTYGA